MNQHPDKALESAQQRVAAIARSVETLLSGAIENASYEARCHIYPGQPYRQADMCCLVAIQVGEWRHGVAFRAPTDNPDTTAVSIAGIFRVAWLERPQ